ncbi:putative DksA/TraR family C4-type zinc finger protein [Erwinia phage vB_EamM_Yoloswag]|uniref:Putative DksA/TraR family C4-type zinc finger protein n=1 Tax=Erwinia phage vB_EamM_Yoloswag TaxID=1958956 RepID=A0A1S6L3I7_9CAUD|nr:DksA-like zinc-finger protein [Erwinia phage vB_EamM_Yoloswag]AQT28740.1 putative DksA/TraR family C4-type zinc finger protein [Erwinia phage vB_EamM_Yoloswag]
MAVGFVRDDGVNDTIESNINNEIDFARSQLIGVGTTHCVECGQAIPLARRKAMPSAKYCIDCQSGHDGSGYVYYNRRGSKDSQLR